MGTKSKAKLDTTHQPCEYKAIAFWGSVMGSYQYYINDQQIVAAMEGAPLGAIYQRDSVWKLLSEVTNPTVIAEAKRLGLL